MCTYIIQKGAVVTETEFETEKEQTFKLTYDVPFNEDQIWSQTADEINFYLKDEFTGENEHASLLTARKLDVIC